MSHAIIKLHECYLEVVTENSKNDHNELKKDDNMPDNNVQRSIGDDCEDTAELILERDGCYNIEQGLVSVDAQLPVDKYIPCQAHVDCETENKGNREKNLEQLNVIIPTCEEHEETFTDRVENNQHIKAAITINTKQEDLQNISTPFRARVP